MADKLTKAQADALCTLATGQASYSTWGGSLITRLPKGIASRATLYALEARGFAESRRDGGSTVWSITDAGRAALSKAEGREGES